MSGLKLLLVGDPGSGKTGACAALANAGWQLRVVNVDGNTRPLDWYLTEEGRKRTSTQVLSDRWGMRSGTYAPLATPSVSAKLAGLLAKWPDGSKPEDWGEESVLVIDPLSQLSEHMLRRQAAMNGRQEPEVADFTPVYNEIVNLLLYLKFGLACHVIVISHLKVPGEPIDMRPRAERKAHPKDPPPLESWKATQNWKRYPSVAGKKLLPEIGGYFDLIVYATTEGGRRILPLRPPIDLDIKLPAHLFGGRSSLDIAQGGLAEFFRKVAGDPPSATPPSSPPVAPVVAKE